MKVMVEISDDLASDVNRAITLANNSDPKYTSHGTLGFETLARMLLEDVAMTVRRPGSWEGMNMSQFLASHGYEV
jgi:hypothetical protein